MDNLHFFTRDTLSCNEPEIMDRLSLLSPRPDSQDWKTELLSKIYSKPEATHPKTEESRVIIVANDLEDSGICMCEDEWRRSYMGEARSPVPVPIQIANEEVQESDQVITELTLNVVDVTPTVTVDEFWNLNASTQPKSYPPWLVEGKQEPTQKKKKPKKLIIPLAENTEVTDIINTPTLDDIISGGLDTPSDNILQWVIDETIAPDEEFPGMLSETGDETPKPSPLLPKQKAAKKRDRSPWIVAEPASKVRRKTIPTKLAEYSLDMPWIKHQNDFKDIKREISTNLNNCSLPDWLKKEGLIQDEDHSTTTVDTNDILMPVDTLPQSGNNVPIDNNGETVIKRKRGRPAKNSIPYITPKLPRQRRTKNTKAQTDPEDHSYVTEDLKDNMKYRRMRDLNNEASRKCRIKRKNKFSLLQDEKELLMVRNNELRAMKSKMEEEVAEWKKKVDLKAANSDLINRSDIATIDDGLEAVTSHEDVTALFFGSPLGAEVESTWSHIM